MCCEDPHPGTVVVIEEEGIRRYTNSKGYKTWSLGKFNYDQVTVQNACRKRYTSMCNIKASVHRVGYSAL